VSAIRLFSRFKELLDVSWASVSDGAYLKRSGTNIVGAAPAAGPPGPAGPSGPAGAAQVWRGEYNPSTLYSINDAVGYNGSSFVATQETIGVAPVPQTVPLVPPLATTGSRGSIAALPPSNQTSYYARGDNTWQILPQTTYVVGPPSSVSGEVVTYADTTGKLLGSTSHAGVVPLGGVVQTKFLEIPSASVTAQYTAGNAPPQITNGAQIGSPLSITPFYSTSFIRVTLRGGLRNSSNVDWIFAAVFRGAIANPVCYQQLYQSVAGAQTTVSMEKYDTPATTSAVSYTVRIGTDTAGTVNVDGYTGTMVLTLQEIRQ
jgi:hypothetical protein